MRVITRPDYSSFVKYRVVCLTASVDVVRGAAVMCDNDQVYESCTSPVEPSCDNINDGFTPAVSRGVSVEGCYCPPGTVRNRK